MISMPPSMPTIAPRAGGYEEAFTGEGAPRPHYAAALGELERQGPDAVRLAVCHLLAGEGVTFGGGQFTIDPVPRVIPADEWRLLEAGLIQRVDALRRFVDDAYGPARIVREGIVPAFVLESADHHERAMRDAPMPGAGAIAVAGLDVVRGEDGRYLVLEDNTRTPSGIAYSIAAREALAASLEIPPHCLDVEPGFDLLGAALRAAAPAGRPTEDPCVVVLSDGPANSAWWEHRAIARNLGFPLVALGDLRRRDGALQACVDGAWVRVDVVYRRTNEDRLEDAQGRATAVGSALLESVQDGSVAVVNAFGAGLADDKLTHAYVEDMIRFYLGEEPLIGSVPSYDLSDDEVRETLLDRIDEIVVKPRSASGGEGVLIGPHAMPRDRARVAAEVRAHPEDWVAQETICLSSHPTVVDGMLSPRHIDLRAFVFMTADGPAVLPGGLTRMALDEGSLVVNSSQGGGAKDTWALG
jgi:carboxylate-amine ligase